MTMRNAGGHYEFSAAPQVQKPKTKYRELTQQEAPQPMIDATNIMWDRRVVRGNTYAAIVTTSREVAQQQARSIQPRPKMNIAKPLEDAEAENFQNDSSTPRAVEGRKHINVYTDENVELLTDKPPKYERDAQTEFIIDRPVNRLYMPVKTGEDRETQIWDGELFNFDYEVEPILQVLMGKTLEQGRMEVLEEEELRVMKEEQKRYDELRYAEMAEAQRMEAEEKKKLEENEKRKKQHKAKRDQDVLCHQKLMSRILAKEYLKNVHGTSLRLLQEQGSFQNHFDYEFNHTVLPWFIRDILHLQEGQMAEANTVRRLMTEVARNASSIHERAVHNEMERRRINQEEKERIAQETKERREKRAEARRKRAEEERKRLLQEKIAEAILSKAEQRPQMFAQILSDLDSFGKEGQTVGLPGGIIGEILLILSTLDELKRLPADDPLSGLKGIEITKDTVQKILDFIVVEIAKDGKIEVGFTGEVEAQLEAIDPELNLETLHTKPTKAKEILALLRSSINSFVLSAIQENAEELGIKKEYIELIINGIVGLAVHPDEKGRRIKLVKAPLDYSQDTRFEALAITLPNPDELPMFNLAEAKGVKQPKKGRKPSKKESISNIEDSLKTEEGETVAANPAEVDFEDAVSVFPLFTEELRILAHHKPVSIVLRREILIFLSSIFKDLDMKELEILKRVNAKSDGIEAVISNKFAKPLDVMTFDKV